MVNLTSDQAELLRDLGLPDDLDGLDDDSWNDVVDRIEDEIQLRGLDGSPNGTNAHGEMCRQVLIAMAEDTA